MILSKLDTALGYIIGGSFVLPKSVGRRQRRCRPNSQSPCV